MEKIINVPLTREQIRLLFYVLTDDSMRMHLKLRKFGNLDVLDSFVIDDLKMQSKVLDDIIDSVVSVWK